MNRRDFGFWGIELDADAFARALAAYGALLAVDRLDPVPPESESEDVIADYARRLLPLVQSIRATPRMPLRIVLPAGEPTAVAREHVPALASAWDRVRKEAGDSPRAEIDASWRDAGIDPLWMIEQLARPDVGFASVYLAASVRVAVPSSTVWTWPLAIGLLPDDASRGFGSRLGSDRWARQLFDTVEIGPAHEACDLLLLPYPLREAVTRVLQVPVRAACVLVLGDLGEPWERARPMLEVIAAHARAAAIGVAQVPEGKRVAWFHELIRELAHDVGLDVALRRAAAPEIASPWVQDDRRSLAPPPLLIADRDLLNRTLVSAAGAELGRRIERAAAVRPERDWQGLIEAAAAAHPEAPTPRIGAPPDEALSQLPFDRESEGATVIAEVGRAMRAQPAPAPSLRFLQAQVREASAPDAAPVTAFRAQAPHHVAVRIGPEDATWAAAPDPFPVEQLPQSDEPHRLNVVFTDLRLEREPQVGEILLPKEGASNEVRFAVQAGEPGERIEARIIVLHRNRVLQTVLLRGTVVADPNAPGDVAPVAITVEAVARARLDDLSGRSRFDAAIVVNHTENGLSRLTRISGKSVDVRFTPGEMDRAVDKIRKRLDAFIKAAEDRVEPDSDRMRGLLVYLAGQGAALYRTIVKDRVGTAFAEGGRIQIVSAVPEAYLPIEYVYDRPAPRQRAKLCRHVKASLEAGKCVDACKDVDDPASVVCPLAFWCLSKVIERHVYTPARANDVRWDYSLLREPSPKQVSLGPLGNVTFAASVKVDGFKPGLALETVKDLRQATTAEVGEAETWEEWVARVKTLHPSLLVLLPHTLTQAGTPALEVGNRAFLGTGEVGPGHVSASAKTLPIVLLLGCNTGDPNLAFQEFPAAFRQNGAAIVLATLTKVLGRHAAPVAVQMVKALIEESEQKEVSFGDVMLSLRRKLLLEGYPMVLALTAYGDADWRFGKRGD